MKKTISIIMILVLFVIHTPICTVSAETQYVLDNANVLSEEQKNILTEKSEEYALKNISVLFVTTNKSDVSDKEQCKTLEHTYMKTMDGVIILINLKSENIYVHRVGKCITSFPDEKLNEIIDQTYYYPSQQRYFDFFKIFIDKSNEYILNAENDISSTPFMPTTYTTVVAVFITILAGIFAVVSHNKNNPVVSGKTHINKTIISNDHTEKFIGDKQKITKNFYKLEKLSKKNN